MPPKPSLVLPNIQSPSPPHRSLNALPASSSSSALLPGDHPPPTRPPSKRPPLTISSVSAPNLIRSRNLSVGSQSGAGPAGSPASPYGAAGIYPPSDLDPDAEDGGRLSDPKKMIDDIINVMNGLTAPPGPDQRPTSRSRSGSSTSIKPPIRKTPDQPPPPRSSLAVPTLDDQDERESSDSTGSQEHEQPESDDTLENEFEPNDLEILDSLGEGAGGEVKKVLHRPSGLYMAKKTIPTSPNPSVHRQILRELKFNRELADGESPSIVKYYGAFLEENDTQIAILMEYCEGGSLDAIYKRIKLRKGRIGEKILGKVAEAVLSGLAYLHTFKIIHRDIKPSNILVSRDGKIKLCDLGVSGELIGSLAGTFTGTSAYMAPERIRGEQYSITSDVWSLGLTLLELALNRFPLVPPSDDPNSSTVSAQQLHPFELLQTVVTFEMPRMDTEEGVVWTKSLQHFLGTCLDKNPNQRPGPKTLLDHHPWINKSKSWNPDICDWLVKVWEW